MFLNEREEKIIGAFMNIEREFQGETVVLKWEDGSQICGIYDSYIEDETDFEMDEEEYEEFWSFVFEVISVTGNPPVYITKDNFFCVNYHNFPNEITVGDKKIF